MARVLVSRPNYDLATNYGYAWLGEIVRVAQEAGHSVVDLQGGATTPENFFYTMETFHPELVLVMGHGAPNIFTGQNNREILVGCTNDEIMADTQSYFISCLMGQNLAPSMYGKGARVVAAYISEFIWVVHPDYVNRPLADPRAYPFFRAIYEPTANLLRGHVGWSGWYSQTLNQFNRGVNEWFNKLDPNAPQIVAALRHDRDSLIVYGEGVTIAPRLPIIPLLVGVGSVLAALFL